MADWHQKSVANIEKKISLATGDWHTIGPLGYDGENSVCITVEPLQSKLYFLTDLCIGIILLRKETRLYFYF